MKLNNKSAFTLLEVIIVVIIIGVLASLALPRFTTTVEASRAGEALQQFSTIRGGVTRCQMVDGSYAACDFGGIDVANPTAAIGSHFTYTINPQANGYTMLAQRKDTVAPNAYVAGSWVTFTEGPAAPVKVGSGAFTGVR